MKVKEVVLAAAKLLELDSDVNAYVEYGYTSGEEQTKKLLACFNMVENDLALNYVPLTEKALFIAKNGCVVYEDFPLVPLRVISVSDEKGVSMPFQVYPTEIRVSEDIKKVVINYAYLPEEKGLLDDSDYQMGVSVALASYGVAAEYCAMRGLYTEAAFWDKKYKESIAKSYTLKRGGKMQSRKWV